MLHCIDERTFGDQIGKLESKFCTVSEIVRDACCQQFLWFLLYLIDNPSRELFIKSSCALLEPCDPIVLVIVAHVLA